MGPLTQLIRRSPKEAQGWLDKAIALTRRHEGQIPRLERLHQEFPMMADVYSPKAVSDMVLRSPEGSIMGLTPRRFLDIAAPLDRAVADPYVQHYKELLQNRGWVDPQDPNLYTDWYLNKARQTPFEGFDDVPLLIYKDLYKDSPGLAGIISGHEGRHRSHVISDLFGPGTPMPVQLMGDRVPRRPYSVYPEVHDPSRLQYYVPRDWSGLNRFRHGGLV